MTTLMTGPGFHSEELIAGLARHGELQRVVASWPSFRVMDVDGAGTLALCAAKPWCDRTVRLTWAAWRRLPYWRRYDTPNALLFPLFDRLALKYLEAPGTFIGWSQMSLLCLVRARALGMHTVLEDPLVHVDTWMSLMRHEFETLGRRASSCYSLMPGSIIRRMRKEYSSTDVVNVLSSFAKQTMVEHGIPSAHVQVTLPGVDSRLFCPGAQCAQREFRVFFAGRLELRKGVPYLLQACAKFMMPDFELWLAGRRLPEIDPFLDQYRGHYRYLGDLTREELSKVYREASVLVVPSLLEGFGLVILEAMASGIPVIATSHTGGPDVIREGIDGFIVPIRDVETLRERILWLYQHRRECAEMGRAARARVVNAFTWDHFADSYVALLRRSDCPK